ncbi:hypothetical protein SAMN05421676_11830 [Salinibacillus kushneri]|uniref:Uncharacterized protein n=1 Tax=Salinibacillus kushneri TaxID=237682 RepID=A0A1I0JDD2_9BACI|nr:hypothetical protein SAMN05421676_11830 [Salinibacillus kushneri]
MVMYLLIVNPVAGNGKGMKVYEDLKQEQSSIFWRWNEDRT